MKEFFLEGGDRRLCSPEQRSAPKTNQKSPVSETITKIFNYVYQTHQCRINPMVVRSPKMKQKYFANVKPSKVDLMQYVC